MEGIILMKIVGIVGNNSDFSYNRILLKFMANHFKEQINFQVKEIIDIPMFSESIAKDNIPDSVNELSHSIKKADGVIIATPEYDHSIPACLKSTLEWLSYVSHPFTNKPVMIVGTSLGAQGTSFAQTQLREILNSPGLNASVLPCNEFMLGHAKEMFNEHGKLTDKKTLDFLDSCFNSFTRFIAMHQLIEV
jgi:NAD(P)H-dependent FMN reductase